jgi:hypothetical protein
MFGSQHKMDIAALEKLVQDDVSSGKTPLLLVAYAGEQHRSRHTIQADKNLMLITSL